MKKSPVMFLALISVILQSVLCVALTNHTGSDLLYSTTTSSYLSLNDIARLKSVIATGLKSQDLPTIYYSVLGYHFLKETVPNANDVCKYLITKLTEDGTSITLESAFYIASTSAALNMCQKLPIDSIVQTVASVIEKDTSSISELYYALHTSSILSPPISDGKNEKYMKIIQGALRKDDSLWNLGYTFHIASYLKTPSYSKLRTFAFDRIEDAVVQADEVDGQYIQFEGGLSITSFLVNGIFKLSASLKKKPQLTSQQTVKLANYFLSRRSVQTPKGVASLLSALDILATNEFERPICITLSEGGAIVSNVQPSIKVRVFNVFGRPLPSVPKVIVNSVTRIGDDVAILTEEPLQLSSSDETLFTLNLIKMKPDRGFYKVSVTAFSATNVVTLKVLSEVMVDYLEIGTGDADQITQPKLTRVAFPGKLEHKIEADSQQKLVIRFLLKDVANKKPMRVHQAFVRLSAVSSKVHPNEHGREIIFVAEPDVAHVYKFDMPVGPAAANFGHQSGDYKVELIVGDAVLSNSFQWDVATVSLKFPESSVAEGADKNRSYKQKPHVYATKPEIKHMFREPEKRPHALVSNLFTGLCLAPILLLFILWAKLGVNISNFPLSISAVLFHLGLGSIFVLFGIFWLKLNMFVTLRYLVGLGVVTFLAGNKLLSHIARRYKLSR